MARRRRRRRYCQFVDQLTQDTCPELALENSNYCQTHQRQGRATRTFLRVWFLIMLAGILLVTSCVVVCGVLVIQEIE